MPATDGIRLRDVAATDLSLFFQHQRDPEASRMAAFTAQDPADRRAFDAHWASIRADPRIVLRTIVREGVVAGYVVAFERFGQREVGYWIARACWGRGVATSALRLFLAAVPLRPLHARVAADNIASARVLEKCGFLACGRERAFANARRAEIEEVLYVLRS
jgi:RimJ/RimL family protein N-acetyltransferase